MAYLCKVCLLHTAEQTTLAYYNTNIYLYTNCPVPRNTKGKNLIVYTSLLRNSKSSMVVHYSDFSHGLNLFVIMPFTQRLYTTVDPRKAVCSIRPSIPGPINPTKQGFLTSSFSQYLIRLPNVYTS